LKNIIPAVEGEYWIDQKWLEKCSLKSSGVTSNDGPPHKIFKISPLQPIEISAVGKNRS